ncbi:DUF3426 domain-containing protein [soil metagenome]
MSLITRCPACTTMFRVVADQLKVAQGWVRCGQCGEVFEASLHLLSGEVDGQDELALATDAGHGFEPPSLPDEPAKTPGHAAPREPSMMAEPHQTPALVQATRVTEGDVRTDPAHVEPAWESLPQEEEDSLIAAPLDAQEPQERKDPVFTANAYGFKPAESGLAASPAREAEAPPAAEESPEVAFVRTARRNEFWAAPQVRTLLGLVSLVLLAALMLQWVARQKDVLAAQEPRLAPLLQALCRPLGCQVRPLRRIEALVIENASFRKTASDAYRLAFVFRNTGAVALEIPALEVTLTDSQDQALVRRVVMPAQFGATASTLGAYSELAGALSLKVAGDGAQEASPAARAGLLPVAAYRILAFYP